jgi:large subunit ribosomal protein L13
MNNKTFFLRKEDIDRKWYVVDASTMPLGRLASHIAKILIGKHKPTYTPHVDNGDFVIVINADKVVTTGKKSEQKTYFRHSMYPGGAKITSFKMMMEKHPERIIQHAVSGMLPKNKMRKRRMKRLRVFTGAEHNHQAQKPVNLELN